MAWCPAGPSASASVSRVNNDLLTELFDEVVDAVIAAVDGLEDWGFSGVRDTQYNHDVVADAVVLEMLHDSGLAVLSEESGVTRPDGRVGAIDRAEPGELVVIVDPVDGSTNASIGLPWFATSLCAVRDGEPIAAHVADLASTTRFRAVRGSGATRNGSPLVLGDDAPSTLSEAIVAFSGWPAQRLPWAQFRVAGACALDVCAVASGTFGGFADCDDAHGVWDYAGAALVLREAGGTISDAFGRSLFDVAHTERRAPVAAATASLHTELVHARIQW